MIRTFIFFLFLWISLILSVLLFIPFFFLSIFHLQEIKKSFTYKVTSAWASFVLFLGGVKIHVKGVKDPESDNLVIISNHQGYMDIPVIMKVFPFPVSFITKKELLKVPLINLWMVVMDCIFIDRRSPVKARRIIKNKLSDNNRNPVVIFPEGTRSRSEKTGRFKGGGLKLVYETKKRIQVVKISGTYKNYEEKGMITPGDIELNIFEVIPPDIYRRKDFQNFKKMLHEMISDQSFLNEKS